jgi:hypothetical protein
MERTSLIKPQKPDTVPSLQTPANRRRQLCRCNMLLKARNANGKVMPKYTLRNPGRLEKLPELFRTKHSAAFHAAHWYWLPADWERKYRMCRL